MSLGEVYHVVQGGGAAVIFLLLLFCALWITRRVLLPGELDRETERRREEVAYRDKIIERQTNDMERKDALFRDALDTIRKDMLPMFERLAVELRVKR
jgi:hypothetical protein